MIKVKIFCESSVDIISNWRAYAQYGNEIEGVKIDYDLTSITFKDDDVNYDIIIFIRPLCNFIEYIRFLKEKGVKVIVDYDDPFPLWYGSENLINHFTEIIQILQEADVVTTTTENLKSYFYHHSYNPNIIVFPNIINNSLVSENKVYHNDKLILGWFGTVSHYNSLEKIKDIIIKVLNEYDNVYFNLYYPSQDFFDLFDHPKVNKISYITNFSEFQETIGDIDINLAPLEENYHTLHKSNIRIILPGYKGIPSIADNFGEYKLLGAKNLILCNNDLDWYNGIKQLIDNPKLRVEYGTNIKKYITDNLTFDTWKSEKSEMFKSLVNINKKENKIMKNYKVIDTFMFGGELEILKMRLDYLYDSVDYFVFSESNKTHNGKDKELIFLQNSDMFESYKDKIHYVVYDPDITNLNFEVTIEDIYKSDLWKLERGQRNQLHSKVIELSDDSTMILHSDCDEFPDKSNFDILREMTKDLSLKIVSLGMKTYYYSPLNILDIGWYGTVALNHQTLIDVTPFDSIRENRFQCEHLENSGWHLSFFNTPEEIQYKIQTYAHQEYNTSETTNIDVIKHKMYNGLDVLNREDIILEKLNQINDDFPIEFYRHEIFFRNTFDRLYLKPETKRRRNGSMQIPLEIENLQLAVDKHQPKIIVEIGTANGGTLARWFEISSAEIVISIDYPIGNHGGQGFEERTYVISDALEQANLTNKQFFAINGDSKDPYLVERLREILDGKKIDFLFIDGDHTYEGVKGDFDIYEQFLNENSIVGFHDILDSEFHSEFNCFVSILWSELKQKYESVEFMYPQLLDKNILELFYNMSHHKGGFGGIGYINYSKKKVLSNNISLVVPIYNNVDDTITNVKTTLSTSNHIDEVILYSNGTDKEGNQKLKLFAETTPIIKLIIVDEAIGFVKAVNESFKLCKNEYMLCLNSDAVLYDNWEEQLLNLTQNENNGLIGPVLCDGFILGCCFIAKKSVLNKIGLLNEGYGLGYCDDEDISIRVTSNGYDLGYSCTKTGFNWDNQFVNFPIIHQQGKSFGLIDGDFVSKQLSLNQLKMKKWKEDTNKVIVLKDLSYDDVKSLLNEEEVFVVINKSGDNFEKIRYDEDIVRISHIFECTNQMNINDIIIGTTKGKEVEFRTNNKQKFTWLAKYDDYASMGILSQKILQNLKISDASCKEIIGITETKNELIHELIKKPINHDLGIMFAYPDMVGELKEFKTKVVYTGVDTTGGYSRFVEKSKEVDYILTPSNISKDRMIKMGVTKPIFVFPHGIEKNEFTYKPRVIGDKFKFLYVGECSDRKGIFHLLRAFTELYKNNPNVELHLKSNTAMLFYGGDEVQKYVDENSNIFWDKSDIGHERTIQLYNECHAYVYPSRADTFGMTVLEAMGCGLPVISTSEPGSTELVRGKYLEIPTNEVPVVGHPWMTGNWGEPSYQMLTLQMKTIQENYDYFAKPERLKEISEYVNENYCWEKITDNFENNILPNLVKEVKIVTLLTSYKRPHHIKNIINCLKDIRENGYANDVYIVDNTNDNSKEEVTKVINENIDDKFTLYSSSFNLGQRGALLQMLDDINIDDYDFIQFTDQDNLLLEPLSTYCNILNENPDIFFASGYMSKEHGELGWRNTRFGNLCEKRSLRAGHMFMRVSDLKNMLPIHLDGQYGQPHNSSWYAGLDWEVSYWNPKSPAKLTNNNFVLCVPGGVLHKGVDSTFYDWDVDANEYTLEELQKMR
jgi:beta-1,4-mannosyl-glycoprotein beta-1,4-N-acetylglucosaminyltransferase